MESTTPSRQRVTSFLRRWVVTTFGVLVAAHLVQGIHYDTVAGLAVASFLLGIFNAFLRPIMMLLVLPLLLFTLGLFTLVINAGLLYLVGELVSSFHVDSFAAAFWGGLVISIVSFAVNLLMGGNVGSVRWKAQYRRPSVKPPDKHDGTGPIIDV